MLGQNDFLPFSTAGNASVMSQEDYEASALRPIGNQPGIADHEFCNKIWRQSALMSAAWGLLVSEQELDALDDGDVAALKTALKNALYAVGERGKLLKAYGEIADVITGAGLTPNDEIFTQLAQVLSRTSPPGAVAYFARASAPTGWLKCNGANVSRTTYAALFTAIGETFGAGDGSTTFALPDLRGEFLRGLDDGRGVDASRALGSAQADELKSHQHPIPSQKWDGGPDSTGGPRAWENDMSTTGHRTFNSNATGGAETRPRNIALLACIKY